MEWNILLTSPQISQFSYADSTDFYKQMSIFNHQSRSHLQGLDVFYIMILMTERKIIRYDECRSMLQGLSLKVHLTDESTVQH